MKLLSLIRAAASFKALGKEGFTGNYSSNCRYLSEDRFCRGRDFRRRLACAAGDEAGRKWKGKQRTLGRDKQPSRKRGKAVRGQSARKWIQSNLTVTRRRRRLTWIFSSKFKHHDKRLPALFFPLWRGMKRALFGSAFRTREDATCTRRCQELRGIQPHTKGHGTDWGFSACRGGDGVGLSQELKWDRWLQRTEDTRNSERQPRFHMAFQGEICLKRPFA